MSNQPRKPPSDTLPLLGRFGQAPAEHCDRLENCPHGDLLRQILVNQELQTEELHSVKQFIVGTMENTGLVERVRTIERVVQILTWSVGIALATGIALVVTNAMS